MADITEAEFRRMRRELEEIHALVEGLFYALTRTDGERWTPRALGEWFAAQLKVLAQPVPA